MDKKDKILNERVIEILYKQIIALPKTATILTPRPTDDQRKIILPYISYDEDAVGTRNLSLLKSGEVVPTGATFLGTCDVMLEKLGYFPTLTTLYIFIS